MTEQKELKTIQIGEVTYDAASVTELGVNIINDIRKVEGKMADHQLTVSIMQLAKGKLLEELDKEKAKFTVVQQEPETPTEK